MIVPWRTVTAGLYDRFEPSRSIIVGICIIGVFLACVTDEKHLLIIGGDEELLGKLTAVRVSAETEKKISLLRPCIPVVPQLFAVFKSLAQTLRKPVHVLSSMCEVVVCLGLKLLQNAVRRVWTCVSESKTVKKAMPYAAYFLIKKQATNKRHYFYLLEKKILDLPVRENETEVQSYLDCRAHLAGRWPFMWSVRDVKKTKILCMGKECVPLSSYSYLDFLRNQEVQEAAIEAARQWSTGNHGPRILGGNMKILEDLEQTVAKFFNRDKALLCSAGFLACMSATAAVCSEDAIVFADSRIHNSLSSGLKIGEGKKVFFRHNDFQDAERIIRKYKNKFKKKWMVVESVYSMDGDLCCLPEAVGLCKKYNIKLLIDEAHGLGVLGKTGRGAEEHFGLPNAASLIVGTFSKSIATVGGYITGPKDFLDYLEIHALGNVFSAPLPAYCAGAALKSFELIDREPWIVAETQRKSRELRKTLLESDKYWPPGYPEEHKFEVKGCDHTTVIPVIFKDDIDRVMRIASRLKNKGFMCSAVAYPACSLRKPRFRITGTAAYTDAIIKSFVKTFVETCVEEVPSQLELH